MAFTKEKLADPTTRKEYDMKAETINWVTSPVRRGEKFVSLGYVEGLYCEGVESVGFKIVYDPKEPEDSSYELFGGSYDGDENMGPWKSVGKFTWISSARNRAEHLLEKEAAKGK